MCVRLSRDFGHFSLVMFRVIVSEDIVTNFEAEQIDKLAFLWLRPSFFLSF